MLGGGARVGPLGQLRLEATARRGPLEAVPGDVVDRLLDQLPHDLVGRGTARHLGTEVRGHHDLARRDGVVADHAVTALEVPDRPGDVRVPTVLVVSLDLERPVRDRREDLGGATEELDSLDRLLGERLKLVQELLRVGDLLQVVDIDPFRQLVLLEEPATEERLELLPDPQVVVRELAVEHRRYQADLRERLVRAQDITDVLLVRTEFAEGQRQVLRVPDSFVVHSLDDHLEAERVPGALVERLEGFVERIRDPSVRHEPELRHHAGGGRVAVGTARGVGGGVGGGGGILRVHDCVLRSSYRLGDVGPGIGADAVKYSKNPHLSTVNTHSVIWQSVCYRSYMTNWTYSKSPTFRFT